MLLGKEKECLVSHRMSAKQVKQKYLMKPSVSVTSPLGNGRKDVFFLLFPCICIAPKLLCSNSMCPPPDRKAYRNISPPAELDVGHEKAVVVKFITVSVENCVVWKAQNANKDHLDLTDLFFIFYSCELFFFLEWNIMIRESNFKVIFDMQDIQVNMVTGWLFL